MLSAGTIHFVDTFCVSRKGGIWEGTFWMTAHKDCCSWRSWLGEGLASIRWAIFLLSCTKQVKKGLLLPCRDTISGTVGSLGSGGALSAWSKALTIGCSLVSGCGQSHELTKNIWKKLWLNFPVLTPSWSPKKRKPSTKYNLVVEGVQ